MRSGVTSTREAAGGIPTPDCALLLSDEILFAQFAVGQRRALLTILSITGEMSKSFGTLRMFAVFVNRATTRRQEANTDTVTELLPSHTY
jgi:hypothetical protein